MKVSIRIAIAAMITCLCQPGWAQYPIEGNYTDGSAGTIISDGGTIVSEGSPIVQGQFPSEGGFPIQGNIITDGGFVNGGAVLSGTEYPVQQMGFVENIAHQGSVGQVSYGAPVNNGVVGGGGILDVVNQKRQRSGLRPLMFDAGLTQTAQYKSNIRANRRMTGHDGSARGRGRVEGVGFAYGGNLTQRFNTCYLYANGYSHAGAAISYDNSGRAYYTLLLR